MTYVKLSRAIEDAEENCGLSKFDPISREIFKRIIYAELNNRMLMIKELSDMASFPTIQSYLKPLIEADWIEKHDALNDKRVRLLSTSLKAQQTVQLMSEELNSKLKIFGVRMLSLVALHAFISSIVHDITMI